MISHSHTSLIQHTITDEIFFALGLGRKGLLRRSLGWLFYLPTWRFARIMAEVDAEVGRAGAGAGCHKALEALGVQAEVRGHENIPASGPAIILANHPGAYDSMALGACVPRLDFKAIVGETRFYHALLNIHPNLIYVSDDPAKSMVALRQAVEHLNRGGILLQFGSGLIEPDPAIRPVGDKVFEKWSPSLEIMLRKVPETKVVPAIASGVLLERFASHPLTHLRQGEMDKRRLAEFIQVIQQLLFPVSVNARPQISFGSPMTLTELVAESADRRLMGAVIARVKAQLADHMAWIGRIA